MTLWKRNLTSNTPEFREWHLFESNNSFKECVGWGFPGWEYSEIDPTNQTNIEDMLSERGAKYGKFTRHALITQLLKQVMHDTDNWNKLAPDQKEALEMTAHKIGRILNGDPNYADSWVDIAGYITLVVKRLEGEEV